MSDVTLDDILESIRNTPPVNPNASFNRQQEYQEPQREIQIIMSPPRVSLKSASRTSPRESFHEEKPAPVKIQLNSPVVSEEVKKPTFKLNIPKCIPVAKNVEVCITQQPEVAKPTIKLNIPKSPIKLNIPKCVKVESQGNDIQVCTTTQETSVASSSTTKPTFKLNIPKCVTVEGEKNDIKICASSSSSSSVEKPTIKLNIPKVGQTFKLNIPKCVTVAENVKVCTETRTEVPNNFNPNNVSSSSSVLKISIPESTGEKKKLILNLKKQ
jgi:hypothetical protein